MLTFHPAIDGIGYEVDYEPDGNHADVQSVRDEYGTESAADDALLAEIGALADEDLAERRHQEACARARLARRDEVLGPDRWRDARKDGER